MLSYDERLAAPIKPTPIYARHRSTCEHCDTEFFVEPGETHEKTKCTCGAARCCDECEKCAECGSPVCPQCSVDVSGRADKRIICSDCHQVYLDELFKPYEEEGDAVEQSPEQSHPPVVHPIFAEILEAIRPQGVR